MAKEKLTCNYHELSAEYYDLNLAPQGDDEVVIGGGYIHCGPESRVERTGFKYGCIEYITAGEGTLVMQGKKHPLYPGTLFYYGPHTAHKIWTNPENPLVKHYVVFTGATLVEQIRATPLAQEPLHAPYPVRLCNIFENLLESGRTESRHRSELCILLLKQLILHIDESAILPKVSRSPAWQTYLRIREHVEQNFQTLGNLGQVAQECHADKAYLCHLFKRYSNETPLQMLTRLKMRRAADAMLSDPTQAIKQVADEAGYPDPYYFSRVFKRVFGISPEAYIATFRQSS